MCLAYNSVAVEDLGKPTVILAQKSFEHDARSGATVKGLPGLRIVTTDIPAGTAHHNTEVVRKGMPKEVVDNLVAALTTPLTEEEKSPAPKKTEKPARVSFKGSLEEVNKFFYRRGWSNGIPVIPPTEEAVKEMLRGTDLPANHVVARIPTLYGNATVEKIAINAVMAGALPTYMPVLIAGVQAVAEHPETSHMLSSLVSFSPCWIINGPIGNDISVNHGRSLLSSEVMANGVIARAMRLIIRNIGGMRPGMEMMSWFGHEATYSLCFAENEEESPWKPFHVDQGLRKEDSAVTIYWVSSCTLVAGLRHTFNSAEDSVKLLLDYVVANLRGGKGMGGANCLYVLSPGEAGLLANAGWTKQKILNYILEEQKKFPRRTGRPDYEASFGDPKEGLRIVVAGGAKVYFTGYQLTGGAMGFLTRKVELPKKWPELVGKYKDWVAPYYQFLIK